MPKKERIRKMFDDIAPEYDAFNHLCSLGIDRIWRRRALGELPSPDSVKDAAAENAPYRVLDVACGTGDFSMAIAKHLQKKLTDFEVVGADISEGMLGVMREKVRKEGLSHCVRAVAGDCAELDFPDASFDAVTVAFGVRNFEDRPKCLKEILRVLKPGGRFIMLELGVPSWWPASWLYNIYFKGILPIIGGWMTGNKSAYKYLTASVLGFPKKKEWLEVLDSEGFSHCSHKALTFGICRLYVAQKGS